IESRVRRSLTYVGLEDTIGKMPAELSGGMRKRVGIARALASGAQTILYDEPTAGLDPINTCMTARLIKGLKSQGLTQIVVTHDLDTAHAVADRIVVVDRGRVIFEGSPEDLKASPLPAIQTFLDPSLLAAKGVFPRPELGEWGETP
ncbi:MAG TPA: ATP-binding cassette domain-containing protein, partial [Nitrospirales bacterium]|nr:ATP-binding cassette domain-containing protein [Nitrospirales bacterium]